MQFVGQPKSLEPPDACSLQLDTDCVDTINGQSSLEVGTCLARHLTKRVITDLSVSTDANEDRGMEHCVSAFER